MLHVLHVLHVFHSFIHNHIVSPSNVANNSPKRRARGFIMITNNQTVTLTTTNANDALAALKAAKATHPFRGTGYNGIGFNNGEKIRSYEGMGFPTWEDDKDKDKKGTYIIVSFNNKKVSLNSFIKDKFILRSSAEEPILWKQEGGFVQFIEQHPFRPEMTDNEVLETIQAYNKECERLVEAKAEFSSVFETSVLGGYAHRVGKYNIVG